MNVASQDPSPLASMHVICSAGMLGDCCVEEPAPGVARMLSIYVGVLVVSRQLTECIILFKMFATLCLLEVDQMRVAL